MNVLAVDIGTSGVRAAVYDDNLHPGGTATRRSQLQWSSGGRVETDPDEVVRNVAACAAEAVEKADVARKIEAISFGTQGEAVVPVSPDGRPIAPCPVSMDRRAADLVGEYHQSSDEYREITGQPLHPMFALFKMAASPEWFAPQSTRIIGLDGYVARALGAGDGIDTTMAARTGAFDVRRGVWSAELLAEFGFCSTVMPEVLAPGSSCGTTAGTLAASIGLVAGTPVVVGSHDQASAFWGASGTLTGDVICSLGSSDCLTQGTRQRPKLPNQSGLAGYPVGEGFWLTLAGTAAGGWVLEWLANLLGFDGNVAQLVAEMSPEETDVLVLPYHAGSGTLDNNPDATGLTSGLALTTTRGEIIKAYVEASGYEMAKILAATSAAFPQVKQINTVGGGGANTQVVQTRVNALGLEMEMSPADAVLRGAAIQAWCGIGKLASLLAAPAPARGIRITPEGASAAHHAEKRVRYRELYSALVNTTHKGTENG